MRRRFNKTFGRLLAVALSLALVAMSMTLPIMEVRAESADGTTAVHTSDPNGTYQYDFSEFKSQTKSNPINTAWSSDGLLKINGSGTMYYHDDTHHLAVYKGNSFDIPVAGNAYITFILSQYGSAGTISVSGGAPGSKLSTQAVNLKGATYGEEAQFIYSGSPTTLTFTIDSSGENYLPGITVQNTTKEVHITPWIQKDFSLQIGDTKLDVTGAAAKSGNASARISSGSVYYALSGSALISADLAGKSLSPSILTNLSPNVVESLAVDPGTNEIVAKFVDQTSDPKEYRIKVQDRSAFVTPSAGDIFTLDLAGGAVPTNLTQANAIKDSYTTDNGILTIAKGNGTYSPYWHDNQHGIAIYGGNYFDVKVAGDASVIFTQSQYGSGGTLDVTNLAPGGVGSFDSNVFKAAVYGANTTYTYNGGATTLRFTLTAPGECYLPKITVKNKGTMESSPVDNEQLSMPVEMDQNHSLTVTPNGHRLYAGQSDTQANIGTLSHVGYYVFNGRPDAATMEADVQIRAIGSSSNNGVLFGMMEDADPITKIAALGIRGDGSISNVYSTSTSKLSAGNIAKKYAIGDIIHLVSKKDKTGWHTEAIVGSKTTSDDIEYSKIPFSSGAQTNVKYGFAFANVDAVITNLIFKDENGNVLYDQNAAYHAVGSAPVVTSVEKPVVSSDRTKVSVIWNGDTPAKDGAYVVELSTDGGATYSTVANHVTNKMYTVDVAESGTYLFRVHGICGDQNSPPVESTPIDVLKPLSSPVIKIESGNGVLTTSWNPVDNATSYEVYRMSSEETNYSLVATVTESTYADRNVVNETPYYYYVIAKSMANSSNASAPVLSVPSAGHIGKYAYGDEAADIFITKKSYDTVFTDKATIQGLVSKSGSLKMVVNGVEQGSVNVKAAGAFDFVAQLAKGRNDVNLYLTDEQGKVTRRTFNFVYLTNYNIVVDAAFTGAEGAASPDNPNIKLYKSVQKAVDSVPSDNKDRVVILIKEGRYVEHLRVSSPNISFIGEDRDRVNISFYDPVQSPEGGDTSKRNAVYIQSSATGFTAENLTFENTYKYLGDGTKSNESADALRVDADKSMFVNVKLLGYQDTLYASTNHQYYYKDYILGNVDFIYGQAQALFDDSDIVFRNSANKFGGYVTAPRTEKSQKYGYIFNNSRITSEAGNTGTKYMLARPWGPDGAATFINTYMSDIINKEKAYDDMSGNLAVNARFFEYYTYGEGFSVHIGRPQLSKSQAEEMLKPSSLGWDPYQAVIAISDQAYVGNVVTKEEEKFTKDNPRTFADLSGHWAKSDVEALAGKLIVDGISESRFAPDQPITRADFAALLIRALGLDEEKASGFSDVAAGDWFSGAVGAAKKANLIGGLEDGSFHPNANITREQMVMMIVRALKLDGKELQANAQLLEQFADRSSISSWSKDAVAQALTAGIIQGTSDSMFAAQDYATRAQAAVMVNRMLHLINING